MVRLLALDNPPSPFGDEPLQHARARTCALLPAAPGTITVDRDAADGTAVRANRGLRT
jgi:hypothetical protein